MGVILMGKFVILQGDFIFLLRRERKIEMQAGLQAAITAFKGMHRKLFSEFQRKKYLNYCINRQAIPLFKAAKYALKTKMTGLYRQVSNTTQKEIFFVHSCDIRAAILQLEISPHTERICEIINKK